MHLPRGMYVNDVAVEAARIAGNIVTCILIRDSRSKSTVAHVAPCKGLDEEKYVAERVVGDIVCLCYGGLAVNADNAASLDALIRVAIDEVRAK